MSESKSPCQVALNDLKPLKIVLVETASNRRQWQDAINRYHYLGYKTPFGAQLRYFIVSQRSQKTLGCLQFSSPALKLRARDQWIGWTEAQRKEGLQLIVQNSRFLIFPCVKVKNLASHILSLSAKKITDDWPNHFGRTPLLMETFVDRARFLGTCYRAANWIYLGVTQGRERMDRCHDFQSSVKDIWVKPLRKKWRSELRMNFTAQNVHGIKERS